MNEITKYTQSLISTLAAFVVVLAVEVVWAWLCLYAKVIPFAGERSIELGWYALSFPLAFAVFPVVYRVFCKCDLEKKLSYNFRREKIIFYITSIVLFGMLVLVFCYAPSSFAYSSWAGHTGKYTGYFTLFILAVITVCFLQNGGLKLSKGANKRFALNALYVCLTALAFAANYRTDSFTEAYSIHHFDAWFHSVYRVIQFQPYSDVNIGIYGHYGILFAPFIKLLGGDLNATMLVVGVAAAASLLCCFYVLKELVKTTWLQVLAALGCSYIFLTVGRFYVQSFPMRTMFPAFILAFMVWRDKRNSHERLWRFCGGAIVVLALICNLETGIGVMLAYVGADVVRLVQRYPLTSSKLWFEILKRLLLCPLFFLLSISVVDVYNLAAGGNLLSLKTYMFPLFGSDVGAGYMDHIHYPMSREPSWWMAVCILCYGLIGHVLVKTSICGSEGEVRPHDAYIASAAILIAILGAYYVNRSAEGNILIVLPFVTLMVAYIAEQTPEKIQRSGHGAISGICVISAVVLCLFTEMTVTNFFALETKREAQRDRTALSDLVEQTRELVEPNTFAIGKGLSALYAELGWDTGYYGPDTADWGSQLNIDGKYEIYRRIAGSDKLLITQTMLNVAKAQAPELFLDWDESHILCTTVQGGAAKYLYYCKGIPFGGSGTSADPYQINTENDLALLAQTVNSGKTYDGMYFRQTNNLDLSSFGNWTPIGTYDCGYAFNGIYDGDGHTISNLNINGKKFSNAKVGLFGRLAGTVCNLGIESGQISGSYIGSIASHAAGDNAMIVNCYNKASLSAWSRCGGIADNFGKGMIICCLNNGSLELTKDGVSAGICSYSAGQVWGCISETSATSKKFAGEEDRTVTGVTANQQELNNMLQEASKLFDLTEITLKNW